MLSYFWGCNAAAGVVGVVLAIESSEGVSVADSSEKIAFRSQKVKVLFLVEAPSSSNFYYK